MSRPAQKALTVGLPLLLTTGALLAGPAFSPVPHACATPERGARREAPPPAAPPGEPARPGAANTRPATNASNDTTVSSAPTQTAPDPSGLTDAISRAADVISPSVVQLRVEAASRGMGQFVFGAEQSVQGAGSGIVIRPDGYILTNNHVVENATRIEVRLQDRRILTARVIGADPAIDLAVVKVEADGLVPARFADSDHARVGQWVVAVGAPFGLDYTVTAGVLSATGRGGLGANEIEDYLQTDASINPGNSGGPLVDLNGSVLGVNAMIVGRGTGIGFAIPSDLARHVADQIVETGRVRRAWIGVAFQEMTPELASYFLDDARGGALVSEVVADGPAARGGLRPGDVIVGIGDQDVPDGHVLQRSLLRRPVGERIALRVVRDRRPTTVTLTTGERPGAQARQPLAPPPSGPQGIGLAVEPLDGRLRQRLRYDGPAQLVVSEVRPGSAADRAGLAPGDLLLEADRQSVRDAETLRQQLRDGEALLVVQRRDRRFFTVLRSTTS